MKKVRKITLLVQALLVGTFSFSQEDKVSIDEFILLSEQALDNGNQKEAFEIATYAQVLSQNIGTDEQVFAATLQLANVYLLTTRILEAEEIFGSLVPNPQYEPSLLCRYYHRKAFFYNQSMQGDKAILLLDSAVYYAETHKLDKQKGPIYNELANIYERMPDYDRGIKYYRKSLYYFNPNEQNYANTLLNLGRVYYLKQEIDSAITILDPLCKKIDTTNWLFIKTSAFYFLAESYKSKGDSIMYYKNRLQHLYKELDYRDEIHNKQYRELQFEYDSEQKNREIEEQKYLILKKSEEEKNLLMIIGGISLLLLLFLIFYLITRQKNKRLSKLLKENKFLIHEANHRIKNNLQLIVSLLARQKDNNQSLSKVDALREITLKIESISTLHQQQYLEESKEKIELSKYLKTLCEDLKPLTDANNIDFQFNLENATFNLSQSAYIGLMLNELVINSIKYAFTKSSEEKIIRFEFKNVERNKILFVYTDNGIGTTNKLKLIDTLCRQLNAEYSITNEKGFNFFSSISL